MRNFYKKILFSVVFFLCATSIAYADVTTNLVSTWRFNDGTALTSPSTAADSTGTNTGTLTNGATWVTDKDGSTFDAVAFDGTNDYVIATSTGIVASGPVSVSIWIKPGSLTSRRVFYYQAGGVNPLQITQNGDSGNYLHVATGASGTSKLRAAITPGTWYHLVANYSSGTTKTVTSAYLNGVAMTDTAGTSWTAGSADGRVYFGSRNGSAVFADASVDEAKIYNRALTASDVIELYHLGVSGVDSTAPTILSGAPTGELASSISSTTLSVVTNESATCKYGTTPNTAYASMPSTFSTTGTSTHWTVVEGLESGESYTYYVRCADSSSNATTTDHTISFSVAAAPLGTASLGKSTDGWSGAIPVFMTLADGVDHLDYPYARATTVTAGGSTFYTTMTWSSANSRYEGVILIGSNLCNGCADPTTGTFTVTVQLDNNSDFGSVESSVSAGTFTTFITRRYNSSTTRIPTYFIPVYNTDHWDYTINDFSINAASSQSNVAVAIPFHPTSSEISNITVTFDGVSVSSGGATSTSNAWWWDNNTHTLYVQKASLGTTYSKVDITFRSNTDLFATRYDQKNTEHIGGRTFYNGMIFSNQYITTEMFGGGHEGAGEQVDLHSKTTTFELGVDCMERVGIHPNNTLDPDTSGYYEYNIKWKQNEWQNYLSSESLTEFVIVNTSDNTATTGWKPQLNSSVSVRRTITFESSERYIKNVYQITNGSGSTQTYPFVWGREPWIYSSESSDTRQTNDRGRFAGDTSNRAMEIELDMSTLDDYWMASYDTTSFASIGILFPSSDAPDSGYMVVEAPIADEYAEWPPTIQSYSTTTDAGSLFFSKTFESVASGSTVSYTFWQWGGGGFSSWNDINSQISTDYAEVNDTTAPSVSVTAPTNGTTVRGSTVSLTASASDNTSVAGVQFKLDTTTLLGAEDTTSTYGITWDSTTASDGEHTIIAVARDSVNNYATSTAVTITVDNTGPTITSPTATDRTTTTATITWTTSEAATSQIVYGTTELYGSTTTLDTTLRTSHSVALSGLSPDTTYHYKTISVDQIGNGATSTDQTFTTNALPVSDSSTTRSLGSSASVRVRDLLQLFSRVDTVQNFNPTTDISTPTSLQVSSFSTPLFLGSENNQVRNLQKILSTMPDVYPEKRVTGFFGPLTEAAIKRFQLKYGIVTSTKDPGYGYVGPKTRAKLNALLK